MRAMTDMRVYERALEQRGLPTYVIGGRGYWSHPQVVDLVSYLRALANPRDEEALYGVLASPLVGVSLDALVVLAAAGRATGATRGGCCASRAGSWPASTRPTGPGWRRSRRGSRPSGARARRCGIEELIDSALVASGYDLAMLAMPGGRRRLANVRKLMRLAREHEDAHGPDLHGFLSRRRPRGRRSAESRESEAPVEGEGLDAIRLMTIHRAKGLEFQMVVVADLGRAVRPPSEIVRVIRRRPPRAAAVARRAPAGARRRWSTGRSARRSARRRRRRSGACSTSR